MNKRNAFWCSLAVLLVAALAIAGCGTSGAESACMDACDQQGKATGCTAKLSSYVQSCKLVCQALVPQLSSDCKSKAEAVYSCQSKQTYKCQTGADIPLPEGVACVAEAVAYRPCFTQP